LKKFAAILFFVLLTWQYIAADTNVPSTIEKTESWTPKNSPYIVDGNVTIEKNGFLTIYPGTVVKFKKDSKITVKGALYSKGDPKNPVRMLPFDGESFYDGINFVSRYKNTVEFTILIRGAITCEGSNIIIDNNYILNSTGIELYHFSNAVIKDNYFYNDTYGVYAEGKELKFSVVQNTFNNGRYALYFKDIPKAEKLIKNNNFFKNQVNLTNYSVDDIEAKENYWGFSEDKSIGQYIFDKKNNEKAGKVVYGPFANVPYKLWEPTDAFISLVRIYLNLKRPDEEPSRISLGAAFNGMMPLTPPSIQKIGVFGYGITGNFTVNITGAFLFGVDAGSTWLDKEQGDTYKYSLNAMNLLLCGYGYLGYKKGVFFVPYLKLGSGLTILSEESRTNGGQPLKANKLGYTAQAGAGLEYFPLKFFSVRLEATANYLISPGGNIFYPLVALSGNVYFDTPLFVDNKGANGPY
jgi:hypothetical protein